jgi:hypothetical protein
VTAETISGIPKGLISVRAIDLGEFLRLAPAEFRSQYLKAKPHGHGLSA